MKNLDKYLERINLNLSPSEILKLGPTRTTLALIMEAQSRAIPFENMDVVLKKQISMSRPDVERKLVDESRGGYCWEQNTLLQMVLEELGFDVIPMLCRVRWSKPDDTQEPNTTFTHVALKVKVQAEDGNDDSAGAGIFLADVAFAGTNSMEPIRLDVGQETQDMPEGRYRVAPSKHKDFYVLELLIKNEWKPLYEWRDERAPVVDMECGNWYSCTYPTSRFTTQFFACRIVGEERHHILNDQYVIRKGHGVDKQVTTEQIKDKERLLSLIDTVFGVELKETEGIDRFLSV